MGVSGSDGRIFSHYLGSYSAQSQNHLGFIQEKSNNRIHQACNQLATINWLGDVTIAAGP